MHGTVRGLFKLLGGFAMIAVLLAAWSAYRISEGPLSLSPLTPYIAQALSRPDEALTVRIDNTILTWSPATRSLEIEAIGVQIVKSGVTIASLPMMALRLSGAALLHGKLVPRSIRFLHPALRLIRDDQGAISLGVGSGPVDDALPSSNVLTDTLFQALLEPPGRESLAGQLQTVQVVGGSLIIEDKTHTVSGLAPRADLTFSRDERGIAMDARLDVVLDGQAGHIDAKGIYLDHDRGLDLTVTVADVRPSSLARLSSALDFLAVAQFPVFGTVSGHFSPDHGLTSLSAKVNAGAGLLDLTSAASLQMPVKGLTLQANYQDDLLTIEALHLDLGATLLSLDGSIDHPAGDARITLHLQSDGIALDALPAVWPKALAPHPRAWIAANLSQGTISAISALLTAHTPAGRPPADAIIDSLTGTMAVSDATVRYVPSLPSIHHVAAAVSFDADRFTIAMTGGEAAGLALPEGVVVLKGLSHADQDAAISLRINASLPDILRFIDNPPLGWTGKFGLDPGEIKGDSQVKLTLAFPMIETLSLDDLKITADAEIKGALLPHIYQGLDLSDATLHLVIGNDGLDASGVGIVDHAPATVHWRENFNPAGGKSDFQSRFVVFAQLSDAGRIAAGLGGKPFQPPYVHGLLPLTLNATHWSSGSWDIDASGDLTAIDLALPDLNYRKPAGIKGQASAELKLSGDRLEALPRFRLSAEDRLDVLGSGSFDQTGDLRQIILERASLARSDLSARIDFHDEDGGITISAEGNSFDAREIVAGRPSDPSTGRAAKPAPHMPIAHEPPPADFRRPDLLPLVVTGTFARVWLSDDGALSDVTLELRRDRLDWRSATLAAEVGDHHRLSVSLVPQHDLHRKLEVDCTDAGALFKALDIFDTMRGGGLKIAATYDDRQVLPSLSGSLTVGAFQLTDAPILARLLSLGGLTGINDLLSGQGIRFTRLDMPFFYQDGILQIHDGQAAGSALGLTTKGQVDFDNSLLGLEGTIVPAYELNSALGGLPLVGGIFSAEKGGGVFALDYQLRGPMADPYILVNPLSALTPGFLRGLFGIFDKETGKVPN